MPTEFQISKSDEPEDDDKAYEWRLRDTEADQTAATGSGYESRDDAMDGAETVKHAVGHAPVKDETGEAPTDDTADDIAEG